MKTKIKKTDHKRQGTHRKHSKDFKQVYWPYMPLLGISFLILVVSLLPPRFTSGHILAYTKGLTQQSLLDATNSQRAINNRTNLTINEKLTQAAQAKAADMTSRNYWSHQTPEGKDPWIFIDAAGYQYVNAGENLAYGFSDSANTIKGWMNSPSHRENLLNDTYTEVGFGYANASDYQGTGPETVVVAMYGRPQVLGIPLGNADQTPKLPVTTQPVTKAQSLFGLSSVWSGLAIGTLAGAALMGLLVNHGLRLRRLIKRSERYFVAHPILDVSLVLLAVAAFNFSRAIGFIL